MTELKRCPFCGGEAKHGYDGDPIFGRIVHWVYCKECHAKTRESSDEDFVIESWNKRENPWHTGTPTEEGWYLVAFNYEDEEGVRYTTDYFKNGKWAFPMVRDISKVIAWQKIEENEDGRTD